MEQSVFVIEQLTEEGQYVPLQDGRCATLDEALALVRELRLSEPDAALQVVEMLPNGARGGNYHAY